MHVQKIFLACLSTLFLGALHARPHIQALQGDITTQNVDAIVNAANVYLKAGNGVCGAIFKAAGKEKLQKACNRHPGTMGIRCPVGEARITKSGDLKKQGIKYIIHAVGPDGRAIIDPEEQYHLLKSAYTASLSLAEEHNLSSIAFPFISSGIYKIDQALAAQAALSAVRQCRTTSLKEIRFVLFSQADLMLFKKLLLEGSSKEL